MKYILLETKKVIFVLLIKKVLEIKELKTSGNLFVIPYR